MSNNNLTRHSELKWIAPLKSIAIIWIFINHFVERTFGFPFFANPTVDWPSLAKRIAQLRPIEAYGIWDIPLNILRYLGWTGDQGVQLFLILSGFGLTWGLLVQGQKGKFSLLQFYRRRLSRIYPLWWGVHLFFTATWLVVGWGLSITDPSTFLSFVGIRITPSLLYYFSPAWWYFGLIVQIYLLFPLLWKGLQRFGPLRLLLISSAIAFPIRAVGLLLFTGFLDPWQRGAIFITRLPEFVFGISLAAWLFQDPLRFDKRLRAPSTLLLAVVSYGLGTALALSLIGMTFAPFLLGVGVFLILYGIFAPITNHTSKLFRSIDWIGEHSYSLYLVHHPFIALLVPLGLVSLPRVFGGIFAALLLSILVSMGLEWTVRKAGFVLTRWCKTKGIGLTLFRVAGIGAVIILILLGCEMLIRQFDPQEVMGWGERPSLVPDTEIGWKLNSSQETRLRWESYDYRVTSNALGFPGPLYPETKSPGTLRILTTGDAFTSAEGVDTEQAWPRLLESKLASQTGRAVQVMNFAITGYGPNQYAAVIKVFAPKYKPDLIIVETFINDFQDTLESNEQFQQSIGFNLPAQDGVRSIIGLENLKRFVSLRIKEPLSELLRNNPRSHGYFLGNFFFLERNQPVVEVTGRMEVANRLKEIREYANSAGAKLIILMVPAPVQVCKPSDLAYFPRPIDLTDRTKFDPELPQRVMGEITSQLSLPYYDLRSPLSAASSCPYQSENMHWTSAGHQVVTDYLANSLIKDEYLK